MPVDDFRIRLSPWSIGHTQYVSSLTSHRRACPWTIIFAFYCLSDTIASVRHIECAYFQNISGIYMHGGLSTKALYTLPNGQSVSSPWIAKGEGIYKSTVPLQG
jgi:hypothetical protein